MEERETTSSQKDQEQFAQYKTTQYFRKEEEHLRLKSRSLWLKAGDKNTAFFHRQCRARLSQNHISEIITGDGVIIKGQDLLKQLASRHFQLMFQDDGLIDQEVSSEFLDNVPSLVNAEDNHILRKPFLEKEIVDFIWSMESDKAPGPDSFSIHFYKVC